MITQAGGAQLAARGCRDLPFSHNTQHSSRMFFQVSITPALSLALPQHHPQHPGPQGMLKVLPIQHIHLSPPKEQCMLPADKQIRCISPFQAVQEKTAIKIRFKNKSARGQSLTMTQLTGGLPALLPCSQQENFPVQT